MMWFGGEVAVDSFSFRDECGYDVCGNVRSACTVFQNSRFAETNADADRIFLDDGFLLKIFYSPVFVDSSDAIVDSNASAEGDSASCFLLFVEPDHAC